MNLTDSSSPLLAAFQLLWKAACEERKLDLLCHPRKKHTSGTPQGRTDVFTSSVSDENNLSDQVEAAVHSTLPSDLPEKRNTNLKSSPERAVVCTFEYDNGATYVRHVVQDGNDDTESSRAEDLFIDWLNCELSSQHAHLIDMTIYFCQVPVSTCCHGLAAWMKNLRSQGKVVVVKLKLASLGVHISRKLDAAAARVLGNIQDEGEADEVTDTIAALQKLRSMNVTIETLSVEDWTQLIALLTDRAALHVLGKTHRRSQERLNKILHCGLPDGKTC